ncbi:MAG: GNAT family N-acetyltransferase [Bacillota bacterium]
MITIRNVKPEDVDSVLKLFADNKSNEKGVLANIKDFMLCEASGKVLGCGCAVIRNEEVYLNCLLVDQASRRDRIGSSIVKALLNHAELAGVKKAYLMTAVPEFADFLRFEKISEDSFYKERLEIFREAFNGNICGSIYFTALEDYFKPCCIK